jgi:DNA-directed RNA polymerase beta' subunit
MNQKKRNHPEDIINQHKKTCYENRSHQRSSINNIRYNFNILSDDEIKLISEQDIEIKKKYPDLYEQNEPKKGGLTDRCKCCAFENENIVCKTCGLSNKYCIGHFPIESLFWGQKWIDFYYIE